MITSSVMKGLIAMQRKQWRTERLSRTYKSFPQNYLAGNLRGTETIVTRNFKACLAGKYMLQVRSKVIRSTFVDLVLFFVEFEQLFDHVGNAIQEKPCSKLEEIFQANLTGRVSICQRCIQNLVKHMRWTFLLKAVSYFREKVHLRCLTGF